MPVPDNLQFVPVNENNVFHWDFVFKNSSEAGVFHDRELFLFYLKEIKGGDLSFLIFDLDNKIIGYCPLALYSYKWKQLYRRNHKYLESFYFGGPVFIEGLAAKRKREVIYATGQYLNFLAHKNNCDHCVVGMEPLSAPFLQEASINPFHEMRSPWVGEAIPYYLLDLDRPVEDLLNGLEGRTRNIIRKFERDLIGPGKAVIRKADPADADNIYGLFAKTEKRVGLISHDKSYFSFFLNFQYSNFYIAFIDGNPACAINISLFNNKAYYWMSYSATEYVDTEIPTYLLWSSILQIKEAGAKWINVGDQPFDSKGSKFDHIAKFKRGFGGVLRYRYRMVLKRPTKTQSILTFLSERI